MGVFDIAGDFAYFAWEGDLNVFKINLKTKQHTSFGEKTSLYRKPKATKTALEGLKARRFKEMAKEKKKQSYVKKIFATEKNVLLVYSARGANGENKGDRLQFYTNEGRYIKEEPLPVETGRTLCMDKKKSIIYILSSDLDSDDNTLFYIHTYSIGPK